MTVVTLEYQVNPPLENAELNALFATAWQGHHITDFQPSLERCLAHIAAFDVSPDRSRLVGFVKLAWDGGVHAFLLDTTVDSGYQHRGIGRELVARAVELAKAQGCTWLHVDFEPTLEGFYARCGFSDTRAGLLKLN
jgi:GNAT superfamily N-acetyltransferase